MKRSHNPSLPKKIQGRRRAQRNSVWCALDHAGMTVPSAGTGLKKVRKHKRAWRGLWPSGRLLLLEWNHGNVGLDYQALGCLWKTDSPLSTSTLLFLPSITISNFILLDVLPWHFLKNITRTLFIKLAWINNNADNPNCTTCPHPEKKIKKRFKNLNNPKVEFYSFKRSNWR